MLGNVPPREAGCAFPSMSSSATYDVVTGASVDDELGGAAPLGVLEPADREPLVHERGDGAAPAVVLAADPVVVGDLYVVEEDLGELGMPGHLLEGPDGHAGGGQVDDEHGEPGVAGPLGVGPGRHQPV